MTMLRRAVAYTALALSVTVGGVIIGATVIAPIVSPSGQPSAAATPATPSSPSALSVMTAQAGRQVQSRLQSMYNAALTGLSNGTRVTRSFVASRRMPQLAPRTWLAIGAGGVLLATLLVGVRLRARRAAIKSAVAPGFLIQSSRPASIVAAASNKLSGRVERTPRAVMALAESGAAPQEIARRTGMPLDAVALCLSISTMGVRQLQPPTA